MSITITLPPRVERRLVEEAERTGTTLEQLVAESVTQSFGGGTEVEEQKRQNADAIALADAWLAEAQRPRSPEEIAEAEREWEELKQALNETRRLEGRRPVFPEE